MRLYVGADREPVARTIRTSLREARLHDSHSTHSSRRMPKLQPPLQCEAPPAVRRRPEAVAGHPPVRRVPLLADPLDARHIVPGRAQDPGTRGLVERLIEDRAKLAKAKNEAFERANPTAIDRAKQRDLEGGWL